MIKSFQHKGLEQFYTTGKKSGIQPHHASKLSIQLTALNAAESPALKSSGLSALNAAESPDDLRAASWRLHQLSGEFAGFWSLTVNGNWRIIFQFDESDVILVDYLDYH